MYDIVPGVLQHLREAEILSRAGLLAAAQGQDYYRSGSVRATYRQGAQLSGIVEVIDAPSKGAALATYAAKAIESSPVLPKRFIVSVEIRDAATWIASCTCNPALLEPLEQPGAPPLLCAHAAALLYYWLAHPQAFAIPAMTAPPSGTETRVEAAAGAALEPAPARQVQVRTPPPRVLELAGAISIGESLEQMALGDLRALAKTYDIPISSQGKQELVEALLNVFRQSEVIRRIVGTLEKPQRQFLATFTLAGGSMSDEELRGLFERFSLGKPEQLQQALARLQEKGLVMRSRFSTTLPTRTSLNALDASWYVPVEVRAALHIALPVTVFHPEEHELVPVIHLAEPYRLLADLLLMARALEGCQVERDERRRDGMERTASGNLLRLASMSSVEGSAALPPPPGQLPAALAQATSDTLPYALPLLRFAYRILRLGEILYPDAESTGAGASTLRMLPNAAELLLGPTRAEVATELFSHWLQQLTYAELFELTEEALRLRCRATPTGQPALRPGELEKENREARQRLVSLLAHAPLHQWISFPAFARFVYRLHPTFLQRRQRLFPTPHWWIEQDEGRPLHPAQWSDWWSAEGRYLARLFQGPLHWWGASDLAFSSDGYLQAFRLTSMAGALLRGMAAVEDSPAVSEPLDTAVNDLSGVELSEQGDILMAPSAGNWPLISLVERFTQVNGVKSARLCYRITPHSLSEALRRGEDLAPFLDLLRCSMDSSDNDDNNVNGDDTRPIVILLRQLEQRLANYGRVRLYTDVTLVEVADTLTLRELAATTSIEQQVIRFLTPTTLLVKKQAAPLLVDELKRRGQVPLLHEDG